MEGILDLLSSQPKHVQHDVQVAHSWAIKCLKPLVAEHWEKGTFPPNILASFKASCRELIGFLIPKEYGGSGRDRLTSCLITSGLASVDASFTTTLLVQYGLCAESILLCGSDAQKLKFLPPLSGLDCMGCFCLTEPQSGSDASDLQTRAVKIERLDTRTGKIRHGYAITGLKRWIGNALTAEVFVVWAKNAALPGEPIMGFIVQRSQQDQAASIVTTKITGKTSMRILQNADVEFCSAWCPEENVMCGHVGFAQSVGRVLESSRVFVAWMPVGIALGAVEEAIKYSKERKAFNAPLASNQLVQEKLTRMAAMTCSMYLLAERVTNDFTLGRCGLPAIAMAKAYNSRVGRDVVALAREVLGGNGIVLDFQVASKFADMESVYTYEGTYDINALVCGRTLTGLAAIKSGLSVKNDFVSTRSKL